MTTREQRRHQLNPELSSARIERIEAEPHIELHRLTELVGVSGNGHLDGMTGATARQARPSSAPSGTSS